MYLHYHIRQIYMRMLHKIYVSQLLFNVCALDGYRYDIILGQRDADALSITYESLT